MRPVAHKPEPFANIYRQNDNFSSKAVRSILVGNLMKQIVAAAFCMQLKSAKDVHFNFS